MTAEETINNYGLTRKISKQKSLPNSKKDFDWQSFRAETSKDILCAMVPNENNIISTNIVKYAIMN